MWRELWYKMAGGNQNEYERIKRISVFEFWSILTMWKAKAERDNAHLKTRPKK